MAQLAPIFTSNVHGKAEGKDFSHACMSVHGKFLSNDTLGQAGRRPILLKI